MHASPRRIALSGSAGTGKTTLGRRLATALDLPYVPEGMRAWLETPGADGARPDIHALGRDGLRSLVLRLWDEQQAAEARALADHGGCVVDRCAYDFSAFWLYYGFAADDTDTSRLFQETQRPDRYDTVWLFPWGAFPVEADGVRASNRWVQLHVQLLIEGVLQRAGAPVRRVTAVGVEERLAEILGCGA